MIRPAGRCRWGVFVLAVGVCALIAGGCGDEPAREPVPEASGAPERAPRGLGDAEWGERLYTEHGCVGCHTLHGARSVGGNLDHIWEQPRTFTDGSTGVVDEAYVRESIDAPSAKVVEGFPDSMPSYRHRLTQAQVDALVAFLKER